MGGPRGFGDKGLGAGLDNLNKICLFHILLFLDYHE